MKINVLGTTWEIIFSNKIENRMLEEFDGYADNTIKKIFINSGEFDHDIEVKNFDKVIKKVLRHEIIHAFLFESGLAECWRHDTGHDETMIDWIAIQFPKILKIFKEVNAL